MDECLVKDLIQCVIHGLEEDAVSDTCDMDDTRFWVGDAARDIWVGFPSSVCEPFVQRENLFFKVQLKRCYFAVGMLAFGKLVPCAYEIFRRYYITKITTMMPPPQQDTFGYSQDSAVA